MVRGVVVYDGDLEVRPGFGRFQGCKRFYENSTYFEHEIRFFSTSDLERVIGKAAVEAARMSSQASQAARRSWEM